MRVLTWAAALLAIAVCLAAAYGAYVLAGYSWDQVVSYQTPFGDYERPWAEAVAPPASEPSEEATRVVLVICDGLTLEASKSMTGLDTLRQYGADMVATTPQPSLSYPTWTNILSGAPPEISGVTTNWFEGTVPVETLIDVAVRTGRRLAVAAPEDFVGLYAADRAGASYFDEWTDEYMTATYVDAALEMARGYQPELLVVHLPDADEAAHDHGADSDEYLEVVRRMDGDLQRLVGGLQDPRTLFVICADHGHVAPGGHGGWEDEVTRVPAVFAGPGTVLGRGGISQSDIAPTIATFLGMPIPRHATGRVGDEVILGADALIAGDTTRARRLARDYIEEIGADTATVGDASTYAAVEAAVETARDERLGRDRTDRAPVAAALAGAALLALAAVFALSWRAGVASLAGTATYYALYNVLYFVVHGYRWSLSAFNTEEYVQAFFYWRMGEAALAGVVGVAVAAIVYPLLRRTAHGPRERGFLGGWFALGPATVLVALSTLALQVAWFLWAWGAEVTWRLPDLYWGFKYDLDLTQMTALGAVAVLAPLVTYLVGRYHPKVVKVHAEE